MPAVNILSDVTCTMLFSALDLGGGESFTGAISFKADTISIKESNSVADHSTAQDQYEFSRRQKTSWSVDVDTKLYHPSLLAALRGNDLGKLVLTAPSGFGAIAEGFITDIDVSLAIPSTMKWSLKTHGVPILYV
jgi:hypothetical protein